MKSPYEYSEQIGKAGRITFAAVTLGLAGLAGYQEYQALNDEPLSVAAVVEHNVSAFDINKNPNPEPGIKADAFAILAMESGGCYLAARKASLSRPTQTV
jgi:hypothetical protein